MNPIALGVAGWLALRELRFRRQEVNERSTLYSQARAYADRRRKPLLVVGTPRARLSPTRPAYPCGDVTLDLDPIVTTQCPEGGVVGDVREIPYPDKCFGAAFVSHVLEHLATIEDFALAWSELNRVADTVYVAYPEPQGVIAQLYPGHHLLMYQVEEGWHVTEITSGRAAVVK